MSLQKVSRRWDNRKNIYVFLTPLGQSLRKTLVPLAEEVNAIALDKVSAEDVAAGRRMLLSIVDNLAQDAVDKLPETPQAPKTPKTPKSRGR